MQSEPQEVLPDASLTSKTLLDEALTMAEFYENLYNDLRAKLNTPITDNFLEGVKLEAVHQVERWGAKHDTGKEPEDWFWLLGYLGGKALSAAKAGDKEKALHHTISSAAALANWHAALQGLPTPMRPGVDAEERGWTDDSQ